MKHIKSLFLALFLISGAASAMNPAPELSQAEQDELGGPGYVYSDYAQRGYAVTGRVLQARQTTPGEQLLDAIRNKDQERAQQLIAAKANVNSTKNDYQTPLHIVCENWNKETIAQQLIAAKANVNATDFWSNTPLHRICDNGKNESIFQQLIAAGADVNAVKKFGYTPLHCICLDWRNEAIAQQLIASKANVNATNDLGNTPLYLVCAYWGNKAIADQLATLMLRTPNAEQRQRACTFLWCLKKLNVYSQLRHVFKEPLLNMIAQENAANPESLFRKQIDTMDDTEMKQHLLNKYIPKEAPSDETH